MVVPREVVMRTVNPSITLLLFASCGQAGEPGPPASQALQRMVGAAVSPDCQLATTCPEAVVGLDRAWCIDDGSAFVVSVDEETGGLLDVRVDHEVIAELALEPGRWWTAFADPAGACERAITVAVLVEVPDARE
jgi:hypothetical protein